MKIPQTWKIPKIDTGGSNESKTDGNLTQITDYKLPSVKTRLFAGKKGNARAENAFAALILIGCTDVKQLRSANDLEDTISMQELARIFVDLTFPSFQLLSIQNSDLDNGQLDEIEQKAQAKNTNRATEWRVEKTRGI